MTAELRLSARVSVDGSQAKAGLDQAKAGVAGVKQELAQVTPAAAAAASSLKSVAVSAGQVRAATANLGQQIGDIGQGLALGISPATIFAQQAGQVGFALSGMGGALGKVGAALSGPFGAAMTVAVIGLGVLASTHNKAGAAAEKQGTAVRTLKDALEELDRATGIANKSAAMSAQLARQSAEELLNEDRAARIATEAQLNLARARIAAARSDVQQGGAKAANFGGNFVVSAAEQNAARLSGELDKLDAKIATSENRIQRSTLFGRASAAAVAATDAVAAAGERYKQTLDRIEKGVQSGKLNEEQATAQLIAAKEALQKVEGAAGASRRALTEHNKELRDAARDAREAAQAAEAFAKAVDAGRIAITNNSTARITGTEVGKLIRDGDAADQRERTSDPLASIVGGIENRLPQIGIDVGKSTAKSFRDGALADAAAIGQIIGGKAGQVFAGISALGFGTTGSNGVIRDLTGTGGKLETLLKPLGDVFGNGGKRFAGLVGQAAGGAATGSVVSGIGDALGIKNSKTGSSIGGAIGSFLPIPGGEIIGSILGGLLPGLFGSKPKGSTTVSSSDGTISQNSAGNSAVQKATGALGNSITDAIQSIAQQLGGEIGDFAVSIGKDGDRFRVDTTGKGSTKKNNTTVLGFDTDEGAALAAAIADALKDGAVITSPRVQATLVKYGDNVNKAVAEALKVKGLEDLLADRGNPFSTAFRNLEQQLKQRVDIAKANGFDLVEIERINGEDRAKALKETLAGATGSIRSLLEDLQFGSRATGSPTERLAGLAAERDRLTALSKGGDTSQNDAIAAVVQKILDLQKEAFGSTGATAAGRSENVSLLNDLVKQTEDRIKAAADAAAKVGITTNDKLTELNASADDQVRLLADNNAVLKAIQASLGGGAGGGGFGFNLANSVAR